MAGRDLSSELVDAPVGRDLSAELLEGATMPAPTATKKPYVGGSYFTDLVDSLFGSSDQNKSVLENYQPTPQEQAAEVQRRLSLGAGPISKETAGKADLLRSGVLPKEEVTPRIQKAAKAMEEQQRPSLADLIAAVESQQRIEESQSFEKQHPVISEIGKEAIGNIEAIPAVVSNLIPYPMVGGAISALNEMGGVAARRLLQNKEITGEDFDRISQAYDRVEQGLTYQPRTERGQERTEDVNSVVQNYVIPGLMAMEGLPPIHIRPSVDYIHAQTKDLLSKGVPPEQIPSYIHQSNLPMYEALAKSKGFLTPEAKAEAPVAEPAPAITPVAEPPPAITPVAAPADIQATIDRHIQNGIPEADARRLAESQVATQDVVDQETGEITNVARPNAEPVGAGAEVAVEPSGGAAEGIGQPERNGNVPAVEDVGHAAAGEGQQPSALKEGETPAPEAVEAKTEEQPYTPTPEDLQKQQAAFEASREKVKQIAKRNFDTAVDQVNNFDYGGNLDAALDAYRTNMFDTIAEEGINKYDPDQPFWIRAADREFDRLTEEYKAKQETKEKPSVTETPEAVETKPEEPQAAAAEPVTEAPASEEPAVKRGRPPLALTPEERIARVQEKKLQRSAYMKDDRAIAKYSDQLEEAIKPLDEGEYENDEALAEAQNDQRANKLDAVRNLLEIEQRQRGTAAGKRAKDILNNRNKITQAEIDNIKRGNEVRKRAGIANKNDFLGTATTPLSSTTGVTTTEADPRFKAFTNGAQVINHIIKTGNPFEKVLAQRLRNVVRNVKYTVVEDGDVLHPDLIKHADSWDQARAMYVRDPITGEGRVYARGASFGADHGIGRGDGLHEFLHAALQQKIDLAMQALERGHSLDSKLVNAYRDLEKIVEEAKAEYIRKLRAGEDIPARIDSLIDHSEFFENPHEFISYSLTEPVVQRFLMDAIGKKKESLFTKFVNFAREALGMGKGDINALSDLLSVTDTTLSARKTADMRLVEQGDMQAHALDAARTNRPPLLAAKQNQQATTKGLKAVENSREGYELGKATSFLQGLRDPRNLAPEIKALWSSMDYNARALFTHMMDGEGLATTFGEKLPALIDVNKGSQRMSGTTEGLLKGVANQADAIVSFFREHPEERTKFENLVNGTTLDQYDPSQPGNKKNQTYDAMYASLPEQGKQLYAQLRQYYQDMHQYQRQILADQIDQLNLPAGERQKIMKELRHIYEKDSKIEPYFPLMRYGDYVLKLNKPGSKEYVSLRFENMRERERAVERFVKDMGRSKLELQQDGLLKVENDIGSTQLRGTIERSSELLKSIYSAIENSTQMNKEALKDTMYQAYLATMPEQSVRKQFLHREGTAGFSSDILRNVNTSGMRMATQFARLKHAPEIRNALESARIQLEGQEEYTPVVARMAEMSADSLQPKEMGGLALAADRVAGLITKASFLKYLSGWSTAFMQPLDIFAKGAPILLGNHGPRAIPELSKMAKLWNQFGVAEKLPNGTTRYRMPSIEFAKGLTADERRAVRDMGITRDTLANEVYSQARKPVSKVDSKGVEIAKDAANMLVFGGLLHHGERLSREVVYLTSYRLSRLEGLAHEAAVERAVNETNETYGNYSTYNRPMLMRGPAGRLLTMYKFFPLVSTKILAGNFLRMLPFMNKEGKAAAATKFFGVMGSHALLGGVVALPLFSVVMNTLGAAWNAWGRDPDAPDEMKEKDYETWWRTEWLPSVLGDTKLGDLTDLVERGVVNKITGLDLSNRISLNDMWFREPSTPGKTLKESMMNWGLMFGGAGANAALTYAQGFQLMSNGDYEAGLEKIAPGSISNMLAAHRIATRGIQDTLGTQLVEPGQVPAMQVAGQAVGFRPEAIAAAQNIAIKAGAVGKGVSVEKAQLESQLKDAYRKSIDFTRPPEEQERFDQIFSDLINDKLTDFNMRNPENEITPKALVDMINADAKNRGMREANAGVLLNKKNVRVSGAAADRAAAILEKAYPQK